MYSLSDYNKSFIHPRLQFTTEEGSDNKLNFLDVTIINNNVILESHWFYKDTFSRIFKDTFLGVFILNYCIFDHLFISNFQFLFGDFRT